MIGPRLQTSLAVRHGWLWSGRALALASLIGGLGWAAFGCRAAVTQPNTPRGVVHGSPLVIVHPAQDTTADSLGTLDIVVEVHDQAFLDSVVVLFQGAARAYQAFYPSDTLFQALIPVALAPLKHQTFSFAVNASNILGEDTTTTSVNVRVR